MVQGNLYLIMTIENIKIGNTIEKPNLSKN
jgi:hypothetical protein